MNPKQDNDEKLLSPKADVLIQTRLRPPDTGLQPKSNPLIINTLLKLKASGLREGTLRNVSYRLAKLNKLCDVGEPEQVKLVIADMDGADSYKANLVKSYNYLCMLNQIEWKKPRYKAKEKVPLVPTTANLSKIISASTEKHSVLLTLENLTN